MKRLLLAMLLVSVVLPETSGRRAAAEPIARAAGSPWKTDVDILHAARYSGDYGSFSKGHVYVDAQDRLWLPVNVFFPDKQSHTDAFHPREKQILLMSRDKGLTWTISERPSPAPIHNRVTLPDGTLIELGGTGWLRYPRSEIKRLQDTGYYVWDLGEKEGYCAIIYDLWQKRSTDAGRTWQKRPLHKQLPFFAHFVARGPLRRLDNGTLIYLGYGYGKDDRKFNADSGSNRWESGRSHVYCLRSTDAGKTWNAIRAADGQLSPSGQGFTETFPIIGGQGKLFLMLRTGLGSPAFTVSSSDSGKTWTTAVRTPINAKHPLPTLLDDGTIVCSYQRRTAAPFGVRARFTSDRGKTWSAEIVLRDDVPTSDALSEPDTVEFSDGTLFTAFQGKRFDDQGRQQQFIGGSHWSRDYRQPYAPKLKVPPPRNKFNSKSAKP
ncbi:MAG: sialidase family protein [Planctomycetaceae bacterium]